MKTIHHPYNIHIRLLKGEDNIVFRINSIDTKYIITGGRVRTYDNYLHNIYDEEYYKSNIITEIGYESIVLDNTTKMQYRYLIEC